ncbi:MAG: winged helix-turn-helix domain-containing protein [Candidatus Bathyarchaeia archaeon]
MKRIKRRDKLKIYGDLLSALHSEACRGSEKIVLTRIQMRINVPFDRLKTYIEELVELDLVQDENTLKLTEKGMVYLREYERVLDFMKRMGLSYQ